MTDSTQPPKSRRPRKLDFPLQVHKARGLWCKTVKGKRVYFEQVKNDPDGAISLGQWLDWKDDLLAGRKPAKKDAKRLKDLCNHWLTHKTHRLNSGELSQRSLSEYKATTDFVIEQLGNNRAVDNIDSDDFAAMRVALAKQFGVNGLSKRS